MGVICYQVKEDGPAQAVPWENIKNSRLLIETYDTRRLHQFEYFKGTEKGLFAVKELITGRLKMPFLLLAGIPGLGKTHLAQGAAWYWICRGKKCIYYYTEDLLSELRRGYRIEERLQQGEFSTDAYTTIIARVERTPLLILDDVAAHYETPWAGTQLDQIVNHRYDKNLATLVTSNTLKISERIIDRCEEGRVVLMTGESYRAIKARLGADKEVIKVKGEELR